MIEAITKLGPSVLIGILFGILLVIWVEPTTPGGTGFLVVFCIVCSVLVGTIMGYIFKLRKSNEAENSADNTTKKKRIWTPDGK